ncbi:MAG: hypothetical protein O2825_15760, partial [Proteobacteria bacterium]|nr:hypothetical protein [Pseudomonadota bacterium]
AVAQAAVEAAIAQARDARALVRFPPDRAAILSQELSHIRARWAQVVGTDLVLDAQQILMTPR